jgi:hypothetical protein
MFTSSLTLNRINLIILVCTMNIFLVGCAGLDQDRFDVREYMDGTTGSTITAANQAMILYSEEPLLAANTRDYISIGPVEVNKSGQQSYLLWIGMWTTIDRPDFSEETANRQLDPIYFLIDGEPMEFNFVSRAGIEQAPYSSSAPGAIEGYYATTRNQIERFAAAADLRISVSIDESPAKIYRLWSRNTNSFADFSEFLGNSEN